jgi:dipeptidyl aminopeptidase/acylaminoacyl peptidase
MIKQFGVCAVLATASATALNVFSEPAMAQAAASDAAARFGAREAVANISLSPDGRSVAFIVPEKGKGNSLYTVAATGGASPKRILVASGEPERLTHCGWVSNDRLMCNIVVVRSDLAAPTVMSRMVALDATGGNVKLVSRREKPDAVDRTYFGGDVVDWLPGEDGAVLMGRVYVPEQRIGTNVSSRLEGYGVDRVDTRTLDFKRVEMPRRQASEYISDGLGNVRIMGTYDIAGTGYTTETLRYHYRQPGSDKWEGLSQYNVLSRTGFNPYAVDPKLNVAYGLKRSGGRQGLFKVSLDGSLTESPVFLHPEVDVDGLVRIGRSQRVVGATFATEKRQAVYFDPELKKLGASLAKALPGAPLIQFVGASGDENKFLIWAGSDVDPGRYYLLDRTTKQMGQLMLSRPELDGMKLATVKPVTYKAADGTMIPGYLTLPSGSAGKKLPAIVMPHGGPGSRDEWGFDWLAQYYAHQGYAVLQPNFRGSSGYGDAWFQKNGFQSWKTAIGDVTDGGRWLISEGIADPGKLAIVGWSYGGYAALQSAVVAPDLFKAVVAIAPVTDLEQLKTAAMRYASGKLQRDFIGSGPHIREGSPAQRAAAIKAPVIQFHGTLDSNVPVAQARLMNDRLKDAGRKSELVIYEGLDHQLDDSAARGDMLRKSDAFIRAAIGR